MTSKTIMILAIAMAFVAGTISTATLVSAAPPEDNPGKPFDAILEKLDQILAAIAGIDLADLAMIKDDVGDIKTETDKIQMVKDDVGDIKTETDKIQMMKNSQYVPYLTTLEVAKNCITNIPTISITSDATDQTFTVDSVALVLFNMDVNDQIKVIRIDFGSFGGEIVSDDVTGNKDVFFTSDPVLVELLGAPGGTNAPSQFTANSDTDVRIQLQCINAPPNNMSISKIHVSGWKQVDDDINVDITGLD